MLFGISWNMFGDSLNDFLDPAFRGPSPSQSVRNRKKERDQKSSSPQDKAVPPEVVT
jgi:hypothetical protein